MTKFNEKLKTFPPVNWLAEEPPQGRTSIAPLAVPKLISAEGRPCGVLDGVTAAMLLQGMESTRLVCALSDTLREIAFAMEAKDMAALKPMLLALFEDGGGLSALAEHIDRSFAGVDAAIALDIAAAMPETTH